MRNFTLFILLILFPSFIFASALDNLEKNPEGPHKNQMFLGGFVNIGSTLGDIITAESTFLENNIYEVVDGTWKEIMVTHLTFTVGISFEWMPIDHLGLKVKGRYSHIIQRTIFGTNYENFSATLYQDASFYLGIAGHLTNRKTWDVSLTPLFGYAIAWYTPTAIIPLMNLDDSNLSSYSGTSAEMVNNFTMGVELAFSLFFKGGIYFSIGFEWIMNFFKFNSAPDVTQAGKSFFDGQSESINHTLTAYVGIGYAFYHH
jgi:hypothetical protein